MHAGVRGGSIFQQGELALQMAIVSVSSFSTMDELLLYNALALHGGQVLRLLHQNPPQVICKCLFLWLKYAVCCISCATLV